MKNIYILILFLLPTTLAAQSCAEFNNLIRDGDRCLKDKRYNIALNNYITALNYCPSRMESVQKKIQSLFNEITNLQKASEKNAEEAIKSRDMADSLLIVTNQKSKLYDSIQLEEISNLKTNALLSDSIQQLANRLVSVRDSMQKERIKDLQAYAKLVDSILQNRKNLNAIAINLEQIIQKERQANSDQEKENETIFTTNVDTLYNRVHAPSVTFDDFSISNDFLTGKGTNYMLSKNASCRKDNYEINSIVIHVTDGPKINTIKWFYNANSKTSDHIIIGQDGSVTQTVPFNFAAWHVGRYYQPNSNAKKILIPLNDNTFVNPNYYTIGIELEGKAGQPFSETQLKVCMQICKLLKQQYHIKDILTHNEIFSAKNCPGTSFPIDKFRMELFPKG